ncbi:VanZ family protein [Mesorhizobium sp. LSJC255A00]|uniref:VanZ family protein n=2 Tax=unclassified Mesorhizobium TaxID=325217 RepID=UPI0003CE9C71|nr:VanZ family protein [Mesorhizobium sp. LSJC255A00]ESX15396.1 VanZ family protein [Mesorhizobium sp. LSJC255A00]
MPQSSFYQSMARAAFLSTLAVVLLLALLPDHLLHALAFTSHHDKLNHAAAFATLSALGSLGWPQQVVRLAVLLAFTGAAIEILQSVTGRDMSVFDWFADCAGMAYALRTMSWVNEILGEPVI